MPVCACVSVQGFPPPPPLQACWPVDNVYTHVPILPVKQKSHLVGPGYIFKPLLWYFFHPCFFFICLLLKHDLSRLFWKVKTLFKASIKTLVFSDNILLLGLCFGPKIVKSPITICSHLRLFIFLRVTWSRGVSQHALRQGEGVLCQWPGHQFITGFHKYTNTLILVLWLEDVMETTIQAVLCFTAVHVWGPHDFVSQVLFLLCWSETQTKYNKC